MEVLFYPDISCESKNFFSSLLHHDCLRLTPLLSLLIHFLSIKSKLITNVGTAKLSVTQFRLCEVQTSAL